MKNRRDKAHGKDVWGCDVSRVGDGGMGWKPGRSGSDSGAQRAPGVGGNSPLWANIRPMKTLPSLTKPSPISRDAVDGQQAGKSLETLADRLRSLGVRYAIVFGSVAANQASPDSDIDVAVLARGPLRTVDRERFMTAIAESTGRSVDLIDLSTARGLVLDRALGGREIVCDSTATRSELIVRKLRAADDCRVAEIAAQVARTRLFE